MTMSPGSFANHASIMLAWKGPERVRAPKGIRIVIGQSAPHLQRNMAALLTSALKPSAAKPPNCISTIGFIPDRAAPTPVWTMTASHNGMSTSLSSCPAFLRAMFIPNAPATSMSSPIKTQSSPCMSAMSAMAC